jgi:hypothetical protein
LERLGIDLCFPEKVVGTLSTSIGWRPEI